MPHAGGTAHARHGAMRSLSDLRFLLATLASASVVTACGGATTTDLGGSSSGAGSSSGGSSGSTSSSSGGSSGSTSSSSGTSGASGSSGTLPGSEAICTGKEYAPLEGVTTKGNADYLELRDEWEQVTPGNFSVVAKAGTPCATAADAVTCKANLEALRSALGWRTDNFGNAPPQHRYLVVNKGDTIDVVTSVADLEALVTPVDNAKDAALLVTATGKYRINCETHPSAARLANGGYQLFAESGHTCGPNTGLDEHDITVGTDGAQSVAKTVRLKDGDPNCAIGRVPEGLAPIAARPVETLGAHFARIARLESASVTAFERLAAELADLGAPAELVELARTSADDERRHADETSRLARRFGCEPLPADIGPARPRSLYEIALENAVEGCARETYGALVATHQALAAGDEDVRAVMAGIAEDETRHAWFSLELHRWAKSQLPAAQRFELDRAHAEAMRELADAVASEDVRDDVRAVAGHPSREQASTLLAGLTSALAA